MYPSAWKDVGKVVSALNKLGGNDVIQSFMKTRAWISLLVELNGKKIVIISLEVTSSVMLPLFSMTQLFWLGSVIVGEDVGAMECAVLGELVGFVVGLGVGLVVGTDAGCCVDEPISNSTV